MILVAAWLHLIGDFLFQTDKMAARKSTSNAWLALHAATYGLPLFSLGPQYAVVNLALHFVVDWMTSRASARMYRQFLDRPEQMVIGFSWRHWFFTVIG